MTATSSPSRKRPESFRESILNSGSAKMQSNSKRFAYTPLGETKKEIRLLHISPQPSPDTLPSCSLQHAYLESTNMPVYETISYCWGDPTPSVCIEVDGAALYVPASSAQVIKRVAQPDKERVIWIDAVCINQEDLIERAQQVTLMGTLYSHAKQNVIYLGEATESTGRALEALTAVAEELREEVQNVRDQVAMEGLDDFDAYMGALWNGDIEFPGSGLRSLIDEDALLALYECPWFSRVWVVQEAALATPNICMWGGHTFQFSDVMQVATCLAKMPEYNTKERFQMCAGLMNAVGILEQRNHLMISGQVEFKNALTMSANLSATDVRDKVFGVLGMCFRGHGEGGIPSFLHVNYQKAPWEVLRDATKHIVLSSGAADNAGLPHVLRWISHRDVEEVEAGTFPSWVPRLDILGDPQIDDMALFAHGSRTVDAGKVVEADPAEPNAMLVKGKEIGTIEQISRIWASEAFDDRIKLASHLIEAQEITSGSDTTTEQLARTLIADTTIGSNQSSANDLVEVPDLVKLLEAARDSESTLPGNVQMYMLALQQQSRNRRVAVLDSKEICLVPKLARRGDVAVAIHADSGGMPYVLRRMENGFKLVGACYVDGRMPWHGEVGEGAAEGQESAVYRLL